MKTSRAEQFIFLYPTKEYFYFEIGSGAYLRTGEKFNQYKKSYASLLNKAIDLRYRQKGFTINYAVFNDTPVSDVISLQKKDTIIKVGLDFEVYRTRIEGRICLPPDNDFILNQLGDISALRVAGFHLWDCVDKLARRAYERGIPTLVDEDLTELFKWQSNARSYPKFKIDFYPSCPPKDDTLLAKEQQDHGW